MRYARPAPILSAAQGQELAQREWPGNVRELRNAADRMVLGVMGMQEDDQAAMQPLKERVEDFERMVIQEALKQSSGSVGKRDATDVLRLLQLYAVKTRAWVA